MSQIISETLDELIEKIENVYSIRPQEGLSLSLTLIDQAKAQQNFTALAFGKLYAGLCNYFQSLLTESLSLLKEALTLFYDLNHQEGIMRAENAIGGACLAVEQYADALQHFFMAQDYALKLNNLDRLTAAYINIGVVYEKTGDYKRAQIYLKRGNDAVEVTGNKQHKGSISLALGTLYSNTGELDTALAYLQNALEAFEEIQVVDLPEVLNKMASIYIHKKDLISAEQYVSTALAYAEENNLINSKLESLYLLGTIYKGRKIKTEAVDYFLSSLHQAEEKGNSHYILLNAKALFEIHHEIGENDLAVEYAKILWNEKTKSAQDSMSQSISDLRINRKLEQAERERDLLKRRSRELEESYQTIHTLQEIGHQIVSIIDLDLIIKQLYQSISQLMLIHTLQIAIFDEDRDELIIKYGIENNEPVKKYIFPLSSTNSLISLCARTRKTTVIHYGVEEILSYFPEYQSTSHVFEDISYNSHIILPLEARGGLVGVLTVKAKSSDAYHIREIDILKTIGSFVSVALANQNIMNKYRIANSNLMQKQAHLKKALTDLEKTKNKIEKMATFDNLTGLPNRYLFFERIDEILSLAKRQQRHFGLCFIDLDNFKTINDTYGHIVGDEALKTLSASAAGVLRKSDLLARIGGDEFIAVFDHIKDISDLPIIAEKLIKTLSQPLSIQNCALKTGASIGISIFPTDGEDILQLIEKADIALYHAKKRGKSCFDLYNANMAKSYNIPPRDFLNS